MSDKGASNLNKTRFYGKCCWRNQIADGYRALAINRSSCKLDKAASVCACSAFCCSANVGVSFSSDPGWREYMSLGLIGIKTVRKFGENCNLWASFCGARRRTMSTPYSAPLSWLHISSIFTKLETVESRLHFSPVSRSVIPFQHGSRSYSAMVDYAKSVSYTHYSRVQ